MQAAVLIKFYVCPDVSPRGTLENKKGGEGESENATFSLLMENILSISPKMSLLFASLLPFAGGFSGLIAGDSSSLWFLPLVVDGGPCQLTPRLEAPPC